MTGLTWRKASASVNNGACVEVAVTPAAVLVRDSKNPAGPSLRFTPAQWRAFLHPKIEQDAAPKAVRK